MSSSSVSLAAAAVNSSWSIPTKKHVTPCLHPSDCVSLCLLPYGVRHVHRYHSWMESAELRNATRSERLTLTEEFEMQENWAKDKDKYTWILIEKNVFSDSADLLESEQLDGGRMIGDVNVFFHSYLPLFSCELEIMIAEKSCRGRGFAVSALSSVMNFIRNEMKVKRFFVKIDEQNIASLKLFGEKLQFQIKERMEEFKEIVMERDERNEQEKRAEQLKQQTDKTANHEQLKAEITSVQCDSSSSDNESTRVLQFLSNCSPCVCGAHLPALRRTFFEWNSAQSDVCALTATVEKCREKEETSGKQGKFALEKAAKRTRQRIEQQILKAIEQQNWRTQLFERWLTEKENETRNEKSSIQHSQSCTQSLATE